MEGGSLSSNDTSVTVKNANAATIYIFIASNFNNYKDTSGDENKRAEEYLDKAYAKSFANLHGVLFIFCLGMFDGRTARFLPQIIPFH